MTGGPVNRGAVAAALERWNERRRGIFYAKTDVHFNVADLSAPPVNRTAIAKLLDEDVRHFEPIAGGTLHKLFRIQTETKRWILKIALEAPDFGFAIEGRAMDQLRALGLPALKVGPFSAMSDANLAPFLFMEEAEGRALTRFENSETQQMPEPLLFEFGRALAQVHQKPAAGAGLIDVSKEGWRGLHGDWWSYISLRLEEHLQVCAEIGAIDPIEREKIQRLFASALQAPMRLLHGDPGHHNVFSDGQRITAIIDWEDALAGDPVFEIAYWGTFVRDEMRARFVEGYETVEKLPADFERRYWLYYLRVALSKTVHRHRFGTKDHPGRPPASRRIQKALSKLAEL
jgi:aminoglycoside phosphotransferase (APT) family kinase protein